MANRKMDIQNLRQELHPSKLLPSLTAGFIGGTLSIIIATSFGALIFSGSLAQYVSSGIGLALFSAFAICLVVALTSSFPGSLAGPQDSPAAILALVAASIAGRMSASATAETTFYTVATAVAVASIFTGAFFWALGRFKLGNLVRFIPYPVIGGFMAGTGWLLLQGAFGVMTGAPLNLSLLPDLLQFDVLMQWLPGSLLAIVLVVMTRRYSHFLIMPALLLSAIALFYGLLLLTHTSLDEAGARGWLLGPFPQGALWQPLTPSSLARVDWSAIFGQVDKIGTILIIGVVSLLLNASGLELAARQDIDLNRELQAAGIGNIISGLGGGLAGYHYLGDSVLAYKIGGRSRLVGIFSAAWCGAALMLGASLLSFFPKPVLGGLLLFLGLSFLVEWVYDAWFKLPRTDYVLVLTILVIVGAVGFLEGVAVGAGIAVVSFVVKYSRINVVKHTLSGANFRSTVDRPTAQRQFLSEKGDQLYILQLQGFIFFGTAQNLLSQIRQRLKDTNLPAVRFAVLDFRRVSGFDSSAISSFVRMRQLAEAQSFRLVFTHLSAEMQHQLEKGGLIEEHDEVWQLSSTLDYGVEWCEDQILAAESALLTEAQGSLQTQLEKELPKPANVARFVDYLEKMEVGIGYSLIRQGDPSEDLYFIESGSATAQLEFDDGRTVRLRTMRGGTVVGEVGLYLGSRGTASARGTTSARRTASVVTTQPSTLYRLSANAIKQMEEKDPEEAAALHRWVAHLMAVRLAENNDTLIAMMD
jgi:SulP family sulfate permease